MFALSHTHHTGQKDCVYVANEQETAQPGFGNHCVGWCNALHLQALHCPLQCVALCTSVV